MTNNEQPVAVTRVDLEAAMKLLIGGKVAGGDGCTYSARQPTLSQAAESFARHRRNALEEAARVAQVRHEQWRMPHRDDAEPGEVCCDVSACQDIATAIRSLIKDTGGKG